MTSQPSTHYGSAGLRRFCLVALLFLVVDGAFLPTAAANPAPRPVAVTASPPASLFAATTGLGRVLSFLESTLSDRRRMIQLAALGMCIGLYILMRK